MRESAEQRPWAHQSITTPTEYASFESGKTVYATHSSIFWNTIRSDRAMHFLFVAIIIWLIAKILTAWRYAVVHATARTALRGTYLYVALSAKQCLDYQSNENSDKLCEYMPIDLFFECTKKILTFLCFNTNIMSLIFLKSESLVTLPNRELWWVDPRLLSTLYIRQTFRRPWCLFKAEESLWK